MAQTPQSADAEDAFKRLANYAEDRAKAIDQATGEVTGAVKSEAQALQRKTDLKTDVNPAAYPEPLQSIMKSRPFRAYVGLAQSKDFQQNAQAIATHPQKMLVLYIELAWLVFFLVFRAWRQSKAKHWFRRLWISFYCLALWWIGMLLVIPWSVLGAPYRETLKLIWTAFTQP